MQTKTMSSRSEQRLFGMSLILLNPVCNLRQSFGGKDVRVNCKFSWRMEQLVVVNLDAVIEWITVTVGTIGLVLVAELAINLEL